MEVSKIQLSIAELELMQNAQIILTKNSVLEKMKCLLEAIQEKQIDLVHDKGLTTNEIFKVSPKISKGENYLGLPYVILDYPRHSTIESFFFIRTMFWWGNFFSCTLHLAKNSKQKFLPMINDSHSGLSNYYIATQDDEWAHHLKDPQFRKIELYTKEEFKEASRKFEFIKIVYKHPLTEWPTSSSDLFKKWEFFLSVCGLIS